MRIIWALVMFILTGLMVTDAIECFMEGSIGWGVTFAVWSTWCLTIGVANLFAIYFKD